MAIDDPYHDEVRVDSIIELTEVLTKEATKLAKKHGLEDPRINAVLTSGYVASIQKLSHICPSLPFLVASMLTENMLNKK